MLGVRCPIVIAAAAGWLWLFLLPSFAISPPTEGELREWVAAEWKAAREFPPIAGRCIRWRVEWTYVPPEPELIALEDAVRGRPDHPGRADLDRFLRRRAGTPDTWRYGLWAGGPGHWRLNLDTNDPALPYHDVVVTPRHAWGMSGKQLAVVDPRKGYPPGYSYSTDEGAFRDELGFLLFGGLSRWSDLEVVSVTTSNNGWVLSARAGGSIGLTYSGHWDESLGRNFIDRLGVESREPLPSGFGDRFEFLDWRLDEPLGRWVSGRVNESTATGGLMRVLVFEGASPFDNATLDRLTAVPAIDSVDPERGPVTFRAVHDFRPEEPVVQGRVGDAIVTTPESQLPREQYRRWTRRLGWVATGLMTAGLLTLIVRRRAGALRGAGGAERVNSR
jgi:hypothetical protein